MKHPQTNGLVERANKSLGEGIKARLDERSKDLIGELSHVLWAHRTMIKLSNGETLFSLTYGAEAVIPAEIGMPTPRTAEVVNLFDTTLSMTTLADKSLLSGGDNKPPMLEKQLCDSWKSRMELYMMNRPHGRMILASIEKEAIHADCDIKAINIILQGLPTE
ncbi:reverse transcriptase domain-containing protein, partial [Tanacetum coccineum]